MEASLESPLIFSISTSGKTGGLALYKGGLLWEINFRAKESYAQGIFRGLIFFKENFKEFLSELEYIAVDIGPGSFTGLRIGLSVVKALDLIRNPSFLPISSLEILAWNYPGSPYPILSIVDAYSKELFIALYQWKGDHFESLLSPSLIPFKELKEIVSGPTLFVSETLEKWEEEFLKLFGENFIKPAIPPLLRAGLLSYVASLKLKKGVIKPIKGEELLPLYLKPSEAERKNAHLSY